MSSSTSSPTPTLTFTPSSSIPSKVATVRATFRSGRTRPVEWRIAQLKAIDRMVKEEGERMCQAIATDLRRPYTEAQLGEIMPIVGEVADAISHLSSWMAPDKVPTNTLTFPAKSYVHKDPLGTVLIIGPWNFPIMLMLTPLIAAIAAGNAAVLKPSEVAEASAVLFQELVEKYLDREAFAVIQGGADETTVLLTERFDHIFYTGNTKVAKIISKAAAVFLTPVVLELGGKNATIVHSDANITVAAQRIMSGKCLNAGQVCLSPDYILVQESVADQLEAKFVETLKSFYGEDQKASADFGRIINTRHFDRLKGLLDSSGGRVVHPPTSGSQPDKADKYIGVTLLRDVKPTAPIMQDEIFGPLLPIFTYKTIQDAIDIVNDREKCLALYVFTSSSAISEQVKAKTSSGAFVVNETVLHISNGALPFGGVGESGTGSYHGKYGFDAYSHKKACMEQGTLVDIGAIRYPPYTPSRRSTLGMAMALPPYLIPNISFKDILLLGISAGLAYLLYDKYRAH